MMVWNVNAVGGREATMSASNIAFLGVQPFTPAVHMATQNAFSKTAQLASMGGYSAASGQAILAAMGGGGGGAGGSTAAAPTYYPVFTQAQQNMQQACFVQKNPAACQRAAQQYGAAVAAAGCGAVVGAAGGTVAAATPLFNAAAFESSIDRWFQQPTFVSWASPTTSAVNSVAVSLSATAR